MKMFCVVAFVAALSVAASAQVGPPSLEGSLKVIPAPIPQPPAQAAQAKTAAEVTLTGQIESRVAAGGDTAGWVLRYRDDTGPKTIEVELNRSLLERVKEGATVRVTGTIVDREKVERGKVRTLVASRLEPVVTR